MSVFLFIISIILIIAGHMVKSLRQKQFADFYEDVKLPVFNEALAAGYILNLAVPFRLGDLLRAVILGRRMKNGFSFAFATVVVDRILDVIVVGFIYLILYFLSPAVSLDAGQSALFYVLLSAVSIALIAIVTCARVKVKKIIRLFTGIFNEKIELTLMFFFWSVITAFRDIAIRSNKKKLILLTTLMWGLYTASYYVIALSITMMGGEATLMGVFSYLFSSSSIDKGNLSGGYTDKVMIVYLALSATLLFVIGVISSVKNRGGEQDIASEKTMMLLPQVHESDRRSFLENYFEGDRHAYVRGYLEANNDIQIISDYSAGSNATTLLAIKDDRTIFRKYVVGTDAGKLHDQVEWIQGFSSVLPLPEILFEKKEEGMTLYDMPAITGAAGFFEFIHTNPVEKSFKIIRHVFDDLDNNLYSREEGTADPDIIEKYIEKKILKNIKLIEENHRFADLIRYEEVVVNGKTVKGFPSLKKAMSKEKLKEIFSSDRVSPIHGDVTVENIIVTPGADKGRGYYLIDPNTGNILDSRFIDYAKLLQSLHGGYEFLMRTERCSISGNEIKFMAGASRSYRDLYKEYSSMLKERFSESELKSIYYHEIANWLRLMPYKLEHDEAKAPVFLAGMLLVADGII